MSSSIDEASLEVRATRVVVTDKTLNVELEDGRTIIVPIGWYPRLKHGTPAERANLQISALGIHWPALDEDISVRGLLLGNKSGENPAIIKWWLAQRSKGRHATVEDYFKERKKGFTPRRRIKKAG
jgi:uncharacterized protein DUF2442